MTLTDDSGQRRLENPHDWVRIEIREALRLQKKIIPVLVGDAAMPAAGELPEELASLAGRHAIEITESRFDYDSEQLIRAIDPSGTVSKGLWGWLSDDKRQRTLAFVGAGLAVVIGGGWQAYLHLTEKPKESPPPSTITASNGGIATAGGITATASGSGTAVVATGPVTITQFNGITLEQYEAGLKRREQEVRAERAQANAADKDKIAVLEKQLADIQAKLQNPDKALEEYKAKLAEASKAFDDLKKEVLPEQFKLAQEQLTQGKTADAEKVFQHVLDTGTENAAQAAFQLAKLAEDRIDYPAAERYYRRAVELQPENTRYLNDAGEMAYTMAHYAEAEPLIRRAMAIDEDSYGKNHPSVARDLNNLAQLLKATNRLAEAEPLMQWALAIDEASYGKDHPTVARDLNNLAGLLQATNRMTDAEPLMSRSLAINEASYGVDHPRVAILLNNLAQLFQATNRITEAEPMYRRALAIDEASFGKDHPRVAIRLNNLAQLLQDTNRLAAAEPLMRRALVICEKSLGSSHPNTVTARDNLAALYREEGKVKEAEVLDNVRKGDDSAAVLGSGAP